MSRFFINRPIFAIVISIMIVIIGMISIKSLPVEQYPDITPPVVTVTADYEGADAVTVDKSVATPIAEAAIGVEDMLYMQSTSANDGTMSLMIIFDIGTDANLNTVFTQNNVNSSLATLPSPVKTQGVTTAQAMASFLMIYTISSDGRYDDLFLTNYAAINIENELLKINGVGNVQILGAGNYAMRVWIKPELLKYYNISIEEITEAIEAQSAVFSAGKLGEEPTDSPVQFTYTISTPPQINTAEQYGDIVLRSESNGSQLKLKDVARIDLGSQLYGIKSTSAAKNGDKIEQNPAAIIMITQNSGSNAVEVGDKVESTLSQVAKRMPDGIELDKIADSTSSIKDGIVEISYTIIFALLLVIFIIYLFIQDTRATLIPLIAIPVSLIGAFVLFPFFGFSVNIISLLGLVLAIGLVVDDAIVVVEAVEVRIEQGETPLKATIEAMRIVSSPIIATTVILLSVFIPISLSGGISGKMFQQFTVTIAIAVTISAFNALTLSPALCVLLLKKREPKEKGVFGAFNRLIGRGFENYSKKTSIFARHAARSFIIIAICCGAIFLIFRQIPSGFLPNEDQGYIMVSASLPSAASINRTEKVVEQIEQIILEHPAVKRVASGAGFNMLSNIFSTSSASMFVELVDYSDRKISAMDLATELNEQFYFGITDATVFAFNPPSIPGISVSSGVTFMIEEIGSDNIAELERYSSLLLDSLKASRAVASVMTQFNASVPQRKLEINRDYAMREGVDIGELHTLISTFLGGAYIDDFNRFGQVYDIYIQAESKYRRDVGDLNSYFIENGKGEEIPLSSFVTLTDTVGVEFLTQFNLNRAMGVTLTPAAGYSTGECMDLIEQYAAELLPDNFNVAWSGVSFQEKNSSSNLPLIFAISVIFIFLALAALYDSWSLPFTIILGIPFALFGAVLFVWLAHIFINPAYIDNLFMQISLIMLIALSAKNAILIIEYANMLFFEKNKTLLEAASEAARLRVRPVIMTALAFIIGVLPLVFASGVYSAARNIIGISLVGGTLIATILGLFAYPMLYVFFGKIAHFDRKREKLKGKEQEEEEEQSDIKVNIEEGAD